MILIGVCPVIDKKHCIFPMADISEREQCSENAEFNLEVQRLGKQFQETF
jgi:hypothetical protein